MITELDYALDVAHQDIDTTSARDELSKLRAELAALRARVAELEAQAAPLALVEDDNGYKLYQCPFCGAVPEVYERDSGYAVGYDVVCHTKGCYLEDGGDYWLKTAEEAVELWNNRAVNPQAATLAPRRCVTCARDAEREMREACAAFADDFDGDDLGFDLPTSIGAGIRALPLPAECADCNPLKPEAENEATR